LGFLLLQVVSGLISDDEIATSGPLSQFASNAMVRAATFYHKNIGKPILIGLIVLHIAAILFYLIKKRENLVRPMIEGDKNISVPVEGSRDDARSRALATVLFAACAALVASMVKLAG
jgi:cytochrome b